MILRETYQSRLKENAMTTVPSIDPARFLHERLESAALRGGVARQLPRSTSRSSSDPLACGESSPPPRSALSGTHALG
jgi:hypothetical protein